MSMLVEVQVLGDAAASALAETLIRAGVGYKVSPLPEGWFAFRVDERHKRFLPSPGAYGVRATPRR